MPEHPAFSIDLWVKVIDVLESPSLRLEMTEALIKKIEGKLMSLNPKSIHANLEDLELNYKSYFDGNNLDNKRINSNAVAEKNGQSDHQTESVEYPVLRKFKRRNAYELSSELQAELLLKALLAYIKVFHMDQVMSCFQMDKVASPGKNVSKTQRKMPSNQRLDEEVLVEFFKKTSTQRIKDASEHDEPIKQHASSGRINRNVRISFDMSQCREDVKFIELIVTNMPSLKKHFGEIFARLDECYPTAPQLTRQN